MPVRFYTEEQLQRYGQHYGDWEYVSLLIRNSSKQLEMVAMSRHGHVSCFDRSGGVWKSTANSSEKLEFEQDGHPRVYSAINSHANYNRENDHWVSRRAFSKDWGFGTVSADIVDRTKIGEAFEAWKPEKYRIIKSTLPNYKVTQPDWLDFGSLGGRWGKVQPLKENCFKSEIKAPIKGWVHLKYWYTQYGVGVGPRGPNMNKESVFQGLIKE